MKNCFISPPLFSRFITNIASAWQSTDIATRNQEYYDRLIESREILPSLDNYSVSCPWEDRGGEEGETGVGKKFQRRRWCRRDVGSGFARKKKKKETRFRRILNDSLTHQTVPSFLLGPKLREFFLNYSRTAYGNTPLHAFKSHNSKTCPFIVFRGA